MKRLLEWADSESGASETIITVLIFLLVVGACVLAGLKYVGD